MPRSKANTKNIISNSSVDDIVTSTTAVIDGRDAHASYSKPRVRGKTVTSKSEKSYAEKETIKTGRARKKLSEKEIEDAQEISATVKVTDGDLAVVENISKCRGKYASMNKVDLVENKEVLSKRHKNKTNNVENEANIDTGTSAKTSEIPLKGRKKREPTLGSKIKQDRETNEIGEAIEKPIAKKRSNVESKGSHQANVKEKEATKAESNKIFENASLVAEDIVLPGTSSQGKTNNRNQQIGKNEKKRKKTPSKTKKNGVEIDAEEAINAVNRIDAPQKRAKKRDTPKQITVQKDEVTGKKPRSRKRVPTTYVAMKTDSADLGETDEIHEKPAKIKKTKASGGILMNSISTNYLKSDFDLSPKDNAEQNSINEQRYNLKISSWNVAGLRSWIKKDGLKYLEYEEPDIFCMQEIKCTIDQLPEEAARIPGYHPYWLCMPGGYAGVAIYSKIMPINVEYGIGNAEFDSVGRIITAEYEKFFLINVYVPNSGRQLVNLEARMKWEKLFQSFVKKFDARKAVIICGDMNVSHHEIDLANPKSNLRSAGFTKEERGKMTELLSLGFVDTFRYLYPEREAAYTYWTYMANARARNVGWRLDYFIISERFINRVVDNCIRSQVKGSDHCPITLYLNL